MNNFTIDEDTGNITNDGSLDFETQSKFLLTVMAKDQGTPPLNATKMVEITIMVGSKFVGDGCFDLDGLLVIVMIMILILMVMVMVVVIIPNYFPLFSQDTNDHKPYFNETSYDISLIENTDIDYPLVQLHAFDKDSGANAELVYSIVEGNTDKMFTVNANGVVLTRSSPNREATSIYTLNVRSLSKYRKFSIRNVSNFLK